MTGAAGGYLRAFRSTYATDEIFYHTIVAQSPFAAQSLGTQPDQGAGTNQQTPLHLIHPSEKRVFHSTEADFELARSTDKFFIRKVSSKEAGGLLRQHRSRAPAVRLIGIPWRGP